VQSVRAKAQRFLRVTAKTLPGWEPPPFDPRVLARALGISIHFTHSLQGIDALIVRRSGRFHILANSAVTHAGRLNFTLAHEIGHLFFEDAERKIHLRAQDRRLYDADPETHVLERMCDSAASELLMPAPHFERVAQETGFHAAAVPRLADIFRASLEAVALRLLYANQGGSCAIGMFEYGVRPSARGSEAASSEPAKFRARRVFRTRSFPFLFPKGKSVPSTSVIYRASLQMEMLEAQERFSLGGTHSHLDVSAYPLHRGDTVEEPPIVCAVFRGRSDPGRPGAADRPTRSNSDTA
jgi:hypothetical protein